MDNNIIYRNKCVLCNDSTLKEIKDIQCYKKMCVNTIDNDNSWVMKYGYCINCFSVQLMTLLNPDIVYNENDYYLPLSNSYTWVQHNISLVQFIITHINLNNSIIEIGSSSFCIGKHLIHYYNDYTVFDYSINNCNKQNNVKYIEGNCETYLFNNNSTIIMSHVFEHLYEPKKFINNCKNNNVKNIIISIPYMDNEHFFVNNQHTFLYNKEDIVYLFSLFNYKLNDFNFFNSNDNSFKCLFFYFTLNNDIVQYNHTIIKDRHLYSKNLLENKIVLKRKTYICPAGVFAINTYNFIINKELIESFIDIDKLKQDKYYGSTNVLIKDYNELLNKDDVDIIISSNHNKNIIEHIKKYNTKINIIEI